MWFMFILEAEKRVRGVIHATLSDSLISSLSPDEGGTTRRCCGSHCCPVQGVTPHPDMVVTDSGYFSFTPCVTSTHCVVTALKRTKDFNAAERTVFHPASLSVERVTARTGLAASH